MGFPARWRKLAAVSGTFDTLAAATITGGSELSTANIAPGTLSCLFTVEAETDTLTITGKWQVSDDSTTWYDIAHPQNPASVVLATGTAGADAVVSKVLIAPSEVMGWKYVRPCVVNGVAEGEAVDTYSMQVYFRVYNGFAG